MCLLHDRMLIEAIGKYALHLLVFVTQVAIDVGITRCRNGEAEWLIAAQGVRILATLDREPKRFGVHRSGDRS